jgi:two-component system, NtrC family, nitrogen regulation response regulator GlnG
MPRESRSIPGSGCSGTEPALRRSLPVARILLLEDDDDVRLVLSQAAAGHGHDVKSVACCADAYSALAAGRYDLLLTDVRLPDGSGHDVAAQAKAEGIPALLISGNSDELANRAPDRGLVFPKPTRLDPLIRAIDELLRR